MKNLILALSIIFVFSSTWAQGPASNRNQVKPIPQNLRMKSAVRFEDLKPDQKKMIGRIASIMLLHEVQSQLMAYFERGDRNALALLLRPWDAEDQTQIETEMKSISEKPKFRVEGASLFINVGKEEVEFKVEDPFESMFQINGHRMKIHPALKYKAFKNKFNEAFEVSALQSPIYQMFIPKAEALFGTILVKGVVSIVRSLSATVGGIVAKEATPVAKKVAGDIVQETVSSPVAKAAAAASEPEKNATREFIKKRVDMAEGAAYLACFGFGTDWKVSAMPGHVCLAKIGSTVGCASGLKKDCDNQTEGVKSQVREGESPPPKIDISSPNDGKCSVEKGVISKEIIVKFAEPKTNTVIGIRSLTFEFEKSASDSKDSKDSKDAGDSNATAQLITKNVVEVNKLPDGTIKSKRIWKFAGDDYTIIDIDEDLLNSQGKAQYLGTFRPPTETKCEGKVKSDACQAIKEKVIDMVAAHRPCFENNKKSPVVQKVKKDEEKTNAAQ